MKQEIIIIILLIVAFICVGVGYVAGRTIGIQNFTDDETCFVVGIASQSIRVINLYAEIEGGEGVAVSNKLLQDEAYCKLNYPETQR